ncbi:sensor histidine kinase [Acidipropionibacterium acidipropionici]|uniref:histidine kinase n=1 Tax=Acidipropionibacterium acidipropionici TaxID=1748 RepID=A0AAC8YGG8_9ACTN|nr:HAMP domain-containing sensor histidine kinase [Acidipropionibacterium acidipropionici]AMS06276.1 sensor protein [Acidipropionibacterium acidipropionici]AOZ47731.1 two-component sensor histidine kinase [Acidipropionibacterium acidipropionici]AZP38931.1 sensor histidine kinase [Acidipropionibacterium acidipropionici]
MADAPVTTQSTPAAGGGSWLDHPTGRGTLGRHLVLRVVAIVAAVAAVVTVVTTLSTRAILIGQLDAQINAASARQVDRPSSGDCSDVDGPGPAPGADVYGNVLGSIFVARCPSSGTVATLQQEGGFDASAQERRKAAHAAQTLLQLPTDGRKHNLDLDGLGDYRAKSVQQGSTTYVVALPMTDVNRAVKSLLLVEIGVGLLALAASVAVCRAVVVRNLKPLNRLAATANQVSELDLDSGEVNLPVRVPPTLSDPATEVGQVGYAFNHMLNNVEGALDARQRSETKVRQFVADASHELRNPLASIRGYAELTHRAAPETPEPVRHAINRIEAQATRMSCLVEDMLLLARLDNDQKLDLRSTDLVEIVLNAVSDSRAAGTDHTWILDLPDDPVTVAADPDRLTQVIINVLSNARKHTPPGTTVTTSVSLTQDLATVRIADTGPGIPESVRDTVFERFARADTARTASKEGSTGLGLSIVAAVMDAHHGSVSIGSRTIDSVTDPSSDRSGQHGTTVTLTLPLEDHAIRPE